MNIVILTGTHSPERGGIGAFIRGFAEGLLSQGIHVTILAATPGAAQFSTKDLPVAEFELPVRGYLNRILACPRALRRLAQTKGIDRVIASSWSPFAVCLPSHLNGQGFALDIICHGMDLLEPSRSPRYRFLIRRSFRRADRIVANSRYTAQLARAAGAPEGKIIVLTPGVDAGKFVSGKPDPCLLARYKISDQAPVLLSVGRLVERKGFDLVIRALPTVLQSHPSAVYLMVGAGPDRKRLADLAGALGVSGAVRFAGEVADDGLAAHYRLAKVFVMPNRLIAERGDVEGFGIVFLEAACCEIPAIGGNSGGSPEAIQNGVTGYIIDPEDATECASRITSLFRDEDQRRQMGHAARRRAQTQFNWTTIASSYLRQI